MAQVTDPIMLDSTGQDIKDQISALNAKIQTLNTLLADLGLVSITPISQEDYDALSQAEKLAGVFDIYDAVEPDIDGNKVSYDSNTSVVEKIDTKFDKSGGTIGGHLTVNGNLFSNLNNGTTSTLGESVIVAGNNIAEGTAGNSRGRLRLYSNNANRYDLMPPNNLSGNRQIWFPDVTNNSQVLALRSDFQIQNNQPEEATTIGAGSSKTIIFSIAKTGYTPIAIAGFTSGDSRCWAINCVLQTGDNVRMDIHNAHTSAINVLPGANILYIKS